MRRTHFSLTILRPTSLLKVNFLFLNALFISKSLIEFFKKTLKPWANFWHRFQKRRIRSTSGTWEDKFTWTLSISTKKPKFYWRFLTKKLIRYEKAFFNLPCLFKYWIFLKKLLSQIEIKEIYEELNALSSRIKEIKDLDGSSIKKLFVCTSVAKLLLSLYSILEQTNKCSSQVGNDKLLTKKAIENGLALSQRVPEHDVIRIMLTKRTQSTLDRFIGVRLYWAF